MAVVVEPTVISVPLRLPQPAVPRAPQWWRDAVGLFAWATTLVVVALWVAGGGVQDFGSVGGAFTSLGRVTGLVSANLILLQVLLIARIPMVEEAYGQDDLIGKHRLVGFTSFTLMLAHLVLITIGYALGVRANVFVQFWEMVLDYPGMLLATAATVALIMVALTSIRRARRRLRYESWHLLHLYAYLGAGLAIPHELWTGQEFLTSPAATIYWWTMWLGALGAIITWRIGVPLGMSLYHDLRVSQVVEENDEVVSVIMTGKHLGELGAAAGHFFNWRFLTGPGWMRAHPYSLSAVPDGASLRITVKVLGDGSAGLAAVKPGTRVLIEGPYGRLHAGVRTRPDVTLIASGIGVSPMRALLEQFAAQPGQVTFIYRTSSTEDLVLASEIEHLGAASGVSTFYVLGPRRADRTSWLPASAGNLGDAQALRNLVPRIADQDLYLCGAQPWMDAVEQAARDCGVPKNQIHSERFTW